MVDQIKNDDANGWGTGLKGFYNIEAKSATVSTVVQASPLSLLPTALITNVKRVLPAIEYTLLRSGYPSTAVAPCDNKTGRSLVFDQFWSQFTAAYFEGLHPLLAKANPWIKYLALPGNKVRDAVGSSYTGNATFKAAVKIKLQAAERHEREEHIVFDVK